MKSRVSELFTIWNIYHRWYDTTTINEVECKALVFETEGLNLDLEMMWGKRGQHSDYILGVNDFYAWALVVYQYSNIEDYLFRDVLYL